MNKIILAAITALPIHLLAVEPAAAEVIDLARSGPWTAYGGYGDDGRKVCGVYATGGGRSFFMKYFKGDDHLKIHLSREGWRFPRNRQVRVAARFDQYDQWTASAWTFDLPNGDGALEFSIPAGNINSWIVQYGLSNGLAIRFPNDVGLDWYADLTGTQNITQHFAGCVEAIAR